MGQKKNTLTMENASIDVDLKISLIEERFSAAMGKPLQAMEWPYFGQLVYDHVMENLRALPGVVEDHLIFRVVQEPIKDEAVIKFGNLYTALLCRGIYAPVDSVEYTHTDGSRFWLEDEELSVCLPEAPKNITMKLDEYEL